MKAQRTLSHFKLHPEIYHEYSLHSLHNDNPYKFKTVNRNLEVERDFWFHDEEVTSRH